MEGPRFHFTAVRWRIYILFMCKNILKHWLIILFLTSYVQLHVLPFHSKLLASISPVPLAESSSSGPGSIGCPWAPTSGSGFLCAWVTSNQPLSPGICWSHSSPSPTLCPELGAFLFSCPHFPLGVGFFVPVLPHPQCSSPRLSRIGKRRFIGLAQTKNLGSCPASPSSHTLLPASQRSSGLYLLLHPEFHPGSPLLSAPLIQTTVIFRSRVYIGTVLWAPTNGLCLLSSISVTA